MAPVLVEPLVDLAAGAVVGGPLPDYHLALWHGAHAGPVHDRRWRSPAALLLLAAYRPALALRLALPRPEAKSIFDAAIAALVAGAPAC